MSLYLLCLTLFCVGLYCIVRKRNIIKIIVGVIIAEYAVNLMFILVAYRIEGRSPIHSSGGVVENMVDPLPQAVVLTAIVIGLASRFAARFRMHLSRSGTTRLRPKKMANKRQLLAIMFTDIVGYTAMMG